jgi:predicted oxidoreductase
LAIKTATGIAITVGTIGAINARRVATEPRTVTGIITGGTTAIPIKAGAMKALADLLRRRHLDRRLDRRPADLVAPVPAGIIRT